MMICSTSSIEALPGYEKVGQRRILLGCWGSFNNPDVCDYTYKNMSNWGKAMFVTPGIVVDGKLVTTDLVDINLNIRILLGSSYYDDWEDDEMFVKQDPLGNPVDRRHPWNQTTTPRPQKRNFKDKYSWVMSPRWYDKRTRRSSGAGYRRRADRAALGDGAGRAGGHRLHQSHRARASRFICPRPCRLPEVEFEWKIPKWSNAIERDRARTYFQAYAAACALHFVEKALAELHAGNTKTWTEFKVPDEAIGCGFHEAVRGVLSHHVVIRKGKIANYHPYPPTPWNANPRDILRHARALRRRGAEHADLRGKRAGQIQRHRHHARGAQFRSVPAVRRAYVSRQGQAAGDAAPADVREQSPWLTGVLSKRW